MSDPSETTIPMKRRASSDTESLDADGSVESHESSSSSEPLIESSKRAKRSHSTVSKAGPSADLRSAKGRKLSKARPWWILYAQELNETIVEITTLGSKFRSVKGTIQIGASQWAAEERETLYRALGLVGRDETRRLSDLVRTKSTLEIDVFLRILQRGSDETAVYSPAKYLCLSDIPAAVEIDQDLERGLEQSADAIAHLQDKRQARDVSKRYGELWLLDRRAVTIIGSDGFEIGNFLNTSDPIAPDATAALNLFDIENFLGLSRNVFMNSCDPQHNYTTFAEDDEEPSLYLTAAVDFYRIVRTLTTEIFLTAHHCALTRIREQGKGIEPELLWNDIVAALEILRQTNRHLRYRGTEYRIGMLRRHNVQPMADLDPRKRPPEFVTIDSAEWWLRRRLRRQTGAKSINSASVAQTDLEQACAQDMQEENQVEKLRLRGMEELFKDHEPFTTDVVGGAGDSQSNEQRERWTPEDSEQDVTFAEDAEDAKEEAYVESLDAILDAHEARRLWKLCQESTPEELYAEEIPTKPSKRKPPRRHRSVLKNWRDNLDYKPEWEQYREPIILQILEQTLPREAIPPISIAVPSVDEAQPSVNEQISSSKIAEHSEAPTAQAQPAGAETEALRGDVDTSMEDLHNVESSDTASSESPSTESSSEVSSSSEE